MIDVDTYEYSCDNSGDVGSCQFNSCMCDVNLADTLYNLSEHFNQNYHFNNIDINQCQMTGIVL